jgi:hypothetical protein
MEIIRQRLQSQFVIPATVAIRVGPTVVDHRNTNVGSSVVQRRHYREFNQGDPWKPCCGAQTRLTDRLPVIGLHV